MEGSEALTTEKQVGYLTVLRKIRKILLAVARPLGFIAGFIAAAAAAATAAASAPLEFDGKTVGF